MLTSSLLSCVLVATQTGQEHELIESMPLLEWFANNYKKFGATLEIVSDRSQEGSQFVKGFGGIGGEYIILLYFFPLSVANVTARLPFECICIVFS